MPTVAQAAGAGPPVPPRKLYIATSLAGLEGFCRFKDDAGASAAERVDRALRLLEKVVEAQRSGDEERLYAYAMQFGECQALVERSMRLRPSVDAGKIASLRTRAPEVATLAAAARASLERRYKEAAAGVSSDASSSSHGSSSHGSSATPTQPTNGPTGAHAVPAAIDAAALDVMFGGGGTSSATTVLARPKPAAAQLVCGYPVIRARELFETMTAKRATPAQLLLVDARDRASYVAGRILWPHCVRVDPAVLVPPLQARDVARALDDATAAASFERRAQAQQIVLYDQQSTASSLAGCADHPLFVLHDALFKFDFENSRADPPVLLDGGFEHFRDLFPSTCTLSPAVPAIDQPTMAYPALPRLRASIPHSGGIAAESGRSSAIDGAANGVAAVAQAESPAAGLGATVRPVASHGTPAAGHSPSAGSPQPPSSAHSSATASAAAASHTLASTGPSHAGTPSAGPSQPTPTAGQATVSSHASSHMSLPGARGATGVPHAPSVPSHVAVAQPPAHLQTGNGAATSSGQQHRAASHPVDARPASLPVDGGAMARARPGTTIPPIAGASRAVDSAGPLPTARAADAVNAAAERRPGDIAGPAMPPIATGTRAATHVDTGRSGEDAALRARPLGLRRQASLGSERAAATGTLRPLAPATPRTPQATAGGERVAERALSLRPGQPKPPVADRSQKPSSDTISALDIPAYDRSLKPQPRRDLVFLYGDRRLGLVGLRNLGNTCYMNSILQCLSHTIPLTSYFVSGRFRDAINRTNPMGARGRLAEEYGKLMLQLWGSDARAVSPAALKAVVAQFASQFDGFEQHDSQEFLAFILDGLHEDLNAARRPDMGPPPRDMPDAEWDALPDLAKARHAWERQRRLNQSLVVDLFEGQFRTSLRCRTCSYESVTFTPFMYLSLPIPRSAKPTLQSCIALFTEPVTVAGSDQWFCPKCRQHREAVNRLEVWALPRLLMVHLKRFAFDGPWRSKINATVDYPVRDLDLSPFVKGPIRTRPVYNLYAVSNHFGTMEGGHYTSLCRSAFDGHWYGFDDSVVGQASESELRTRDAYVLFYSCIDFMAEKDEMFSRPPSARSTL